MLQKICINKKKAYLCIGLRMKVLFTGNPIGY